MTAVIRSTESRGLAACPEDERAPRIHMMEKRRSEKKDGFKASLMTCTSDTVRTHLQRCRTLGEGLLKLCAHQSPYTGHTHRLFPLPQAARRSGGGSRNNGLRFSSPAFNYYAQCAQRGGGRRRSPVPEFRARFNCA